MNISIAIIPLMLLLCIPVLIGVYVYNDAKRRGMSPALWTLITILAPAFTGFIVYLIVRVSYSDLRCPSCDARVEEQYTACPKCGTRLKAVCPNCSFPVEPDWSVCPKCTTSLSGQQYSVTPPEQQKDTSLGKVLIAVVLILVLLFSLIIAFSMSAFSVSSSMNTMYVTKEHYVNEPRVLMWMEACDKNPEQTYALLYKGQKGEDKVTSYLIYRPSNDPYTDVETSNQSGLFGVKIQVDFSQNADPYPNENRLISVTTTSSSKRHADLKITQNGKTIPYELTEVDFYPAVIYLSEEYH